MGPVSRSINIKRTEPNLTSPSATWLLALLDLVLVNLEKAAAAMDYTDWESMNKSIRCHLTILSRWFLKDLTVLRLQLLSDWSLPQKVSVANYVFHLLITPTGKKYTVSKRIVQNYFCQNFLKFTPTMWKFCWPKDGKEGQLMQGRCTHFPRHLIYVNALPC